MYLMEHKIGDRFERRGYDLQKLTELVNRLSVEDDVYSSARVVNRAEDLGINLKELLVAIQTGVVISFEVSPSRSEMRLEIQCDVGDMSQYKPVVWMEVSHALFLEDIRHGEGLGITA